MIWGDLLRAMYEMEKEIKAEGETLGTDNAAYTIFARP